MELDFIDKTNGATVWDQLAKMLIGSTVGFLTGKLAENAYDKFIITRRNQPTPSTEG